MGAAVDDDDFHRNFVHRQPVEISAIVVVVVAAVQRTTHTLCFVNAAQQLSSNFDGTLQS